MDKLYEKKKSGYIKSRGFQDLFVSSLMFCFLEKLLVFMLTHLFLTPFYNVPHRPTSFLLISDVL
jgi:hypothetical protein